MSGLAYAWGDNTYGQLGDGSTTSHSVPTSVSSAISWSAIAAGEYSFAIAINGANGLAYGWGDNVAGQLGDNSRTSHSVPTSVSSTISWAKISAGTYFTLGINGANGLAYGWGSNASGQLGDGSTTSHSVPTSVSSAISWKDIICTGTFYTSIAINGANGFAYGWGKNTSGQLGDGSITNRSIPTSVSSAISWGKIATGYIHTVGINGANGLAYGWGSNASGQLGDGSTSGHSVPTSVSSTISWSKIACGDNHTIAINGANGLAYAWGDNTYGQLGDNSRTSHSVPTSVSSAISWSAIAGGYGFTIAINGANGLAYGWGLNTYGNLGNNTTTSYSVPTSVSSAISWASIAAGYDFTTGIGGQTTPPATTAYWNRVPVASVAKYNTIAKASLKKINGVTL
jgi:alpha-tubulin suppressor-like RCC1 family protein